METSKIEDKDEITFKLENTDIKFSTYFNDKLDTTFRKENMSKEILIQNLNKSIKLLQKISSELTNIIRKDINTFNSLCVSYQINSYDYVVILKLLEELTSAILNKVDQNNDVLKISEFSDFFENNQKDHDIIINQHKQFDTDFSEIKKIINPIIDHVKYISKSSHEFGIVFMCYVVIFLLYLLDKIETQLNKFKNIENFNDIDKNIYQSNKIIFFDLTLLLKESENIDMVLFYGFNVDKNDIFNYEENSEEWKNLRKVLFRVISNKSDKIRENSEKMKNTINKVTLLFNKALDKDSYFVTNLLRATGMAIKFKLNKDPEINYEAKESQLISKKTLVEEFSKLRRNILLKKVRQRFLPKITFKQKIYMKKELPEINLEYIKSLLIKLYGKEVIEKNFGDTKQPEREKLPNLEKMPLWGKKIKKEDKKYYISTTLLNNYELNLNDPPYNEQPKNIFSNFHLFNSNKKTINKNPPKALLIHIHGGGFLKSSTFNQENFLRLFSIKLNIPLIGINYSGAPEHPYPEGLNECYQSYMWILNHCEKELGFKPEKIILSGDSAGGNYILVLTLLIIAINELENKNIKLPNLVIAEYPCCYAGENNLNLSLLLTYEDLIFGIDTFKYVNQSYRGYYKNELDPFLNPRIADERLLKKMPKVRFLTGSHDPLRDDCIRMLYKMSQIPGVDVKGYDFKNYGHGFMGAPKDVSYPPRNIFYQEIEEVLKK